MSMKISPRSRWFLLLLGCFLVLSIPVLVYGYQCIYYSDTAMISYPGYGDVCSGYGSGCTECSSTESGESCVAEGFTDCFQQEHKN